jgi:hypothetical protein
MNVFNRILCKEIIKFEPCCVNKEFKTEVLRCLKQKVEGIFTKTGLCFLYEIVNCASYATTFQRPCFVKFEAKKK